MQGHPIQENVCVTKIVSRVAAMTCYQFLSSGSFQTSFKLLAMNLMCRN